MSCKRTCVVRQAHGIAASMHLVLTAQALPSPHLLTAAHHHMVVGGKMVLHPAKGQDGVRLLQRILPPTGG